VTVPKSLVVLNKGVYRSLDPGMWPVLNASIAVQNEGRQASAADSDDTMDLLRVQRMTIAGPEPVVAGLRDIGLTMTEEWTGRTGPDAQRILQAYQARSAGGQ
jgi:hypothetical protein